MNTAKQIQLVLLDNVGRMMLYTFQEVVSCASTEGEEFGGLQLLDFRFKGIH